ncbi:Ribonuclease P protein subunit p14 [Dissostichus eleginoides]|uniref:Ribonuclease P protein subunit p14 n=1 Tax=Dissostichus eleginoides TaxID=100907 RepID=A0AAD9CGZ7_DISEL|nr:Ribonuclease P protein subunit p14 [Dissostichus eleginoides]
MSCADTKDKPALYQRVVLKNASPYHYMKVCLVLEDESTRLSAVDLKQFIISGLDSLYGEVSSPTLGQRFNSHSGICSDNP